MPIISQPGPCQLWITFPALTFPQVPSHEEGDMFIAIASSSPPLLPTGQAEQLLSSPSPTFLYGARICAWMNISPGSLSCNPKNEGGTLTAMEESQFGFSPANDTGER